MSTSMRSFMRRMIRRVARVLLFAVAIAPSVECFASAQMTPAQHVCCAAMKGECDMAVSASCCPTDTTESLGVVSTKQIVDFNPVSMLVAVLSVPLVAASVDHVVPAPEGSSSGPPGVPTYLFVSSFRI